MQRVWTYSIQAVEPAYADRFCIRELDDWWVSIWLSGWSIEHENAIAMTSSRFQTCARSWSPVRMPLMSWYLRMCSYTSEVSRGQWRLFSQRCDLVVS